MQSVERLMQLDHVGAAYDTLPVVDDVTFAVDRGEFVGIVGPSAAGKTTVLRLMLGLVGPMYGTVTTNGAAMGYVPQVETVDWNFPVTVREVVEMARPVPRLPWRRRHVFEPGEVSALVAARTGSTIELSWDEPAVAGGTAPAYDVVRSGSPDVRGIRTLRERRAGAHDLGDAQPELAREIEVPLIVPGTAMIAPVP